MNIDFIHRIGLMVFFILVQVLILNHIHLFNVATPLVYNFVPSMAKMGFVKYSTYVLLLTFIFCFTLFTLEAFSFFNWTQWLLCILGSWGVTSFIIIAIDSVRK